MLRTCLRISDKQWQSAHSQFVVPTNPRPCQPHPKASTTERSAVSSLRLIGVNCGAAFSWQRCRPMSEGSWRQQCSKPEQTHQGNLGCRPEAYKEPKASSVVPKNRTLSPQREKTRDEKRAEQNALQCSCIVCILL